MYMKKNIETKEPILIDVRTPEEYNMGHVPHAINIPLQVLLEEIQTYDFPVDASIAVCCESGGRSGVAQSMLMQKGFTHVVNIGSWRNI